MVTRTAPLLEKLLDQFEKQTLTMDAAALDRVAGEIAKLFGVQADEVAVLEIKPPGKFLQFVLPEKLRVVGSIPMTSTAALAARTARERRGEIANNFSSSRHASVFEGVPLGRRTSEAIQKLMSAPIVQGEKVIGVVQICRKGETASACGPDFTPADLNGLRALNALLARFLALERSA